MTSGEDKQVPEQADSSAQHVLFAFITLLSDQGKTKNLTNKQRSEKSICVIVCLNVCSAYHWVVLCTLYDYDSSLNPDHPSLTFSWTKSLTSLLQTFFCFVFLMTPAPNDHGCRLLPWRHLLE